VNRNQIITFCLSLSLFSLSACTKDSSGTQGSPTANPYAGGGTSQPSGGGNGIDNLANEMYRKDIQTFPEYKHFIVPILRKMAQNKPDVFLMYLKWSVQKRWYFVPKELDELSKDKTQIPFKSDQLALQYDREIYLYAPGYSKAPELARATLLLHEMVMGARLLMKKSPEAQCEELTSKDGLDLCKDDKFLKLAQPPNGTGDAAVLDGLDHSSVRSMTTLLMDKDQDLSALNVFALRKRLGFDFPWDITFSKVTQGDLEQALMRASYAEENYTAQPSSLNTDPVACRIAVDQSNPPYSPLMIGSARPNAPANPAFNHSIIVGKNLMNDPSGVYQQIDVVVWSSLTKDAQYAYGGFDATGVVDPYGSNAVVDKLTLTPGYYAMPPGGEQQLFYLVELFVSRGEQPMLLGYRLVPVRPLIKNADDAGPGGVLKNVEWIIVSSKTPMDCRRSSAH
jgi:hypothetical protein